MTPALVSILGLFCIILIGAFIVLAIKIVWLSGKSLYSLLRGKP